MRYLEWRMGQVLAWVRRGRGRRREKFLVKFLCLSIWASCLFLCCIKWYWSLLFWPFVLIHGIGFRCGGIFCLQEFKIERGSCKRRDWSICKWTASGKERILSTIGGLSHLLAVGYKPFCCVHEFLINFYWRDISSVPLIFWI